MSQGFAGGSTEKSGLCVVGAQGLAVTILLLYKVPGTQ